MVSPWQVSLPWNFSFLSFSFHFVSFLFSFSFSNHWGIYRIRTYCPCVGRQINNSTVWGLQEICSSDARSRSFWLFISKETERESDTERSRRGPRQSQAGLGRLLTVRLHHCLCPQNIRKAGALLNGTLSGACPLRWWGLLKNSFLRSCLSR